MILDTVCPSCTWRTAWTRNNRIIRIGLPTTRTQREPHHAYFPIGDDLLGMSIPV